MLFRKLLPFMMAVAPTFVAASTPPLTTGAAVLFPSGSHQFSPSSDVMALLGNIRYAAMITVNGRTSGASISEKSEKLAFSRAMAARQWLISQGISPEKVMINFASGVDLIASNSTPEGQQLNQRVDIEVTYVPTSSLPMNLQATPQYRCPVPTPRVEPAIKSSFTYAVTEPRTVQPLSPLATQVSQKVESLAATPSTASAIAAASLPRPVPESGLIAKSTVKAEKKNINTFSLIVRAGETWEQSIARWARDNGYKSVMNFFPDHGAPAGLSSIPKTTLFPGVNFISALENVKRAIEKENGANINIFFDESNKAAVIHQPGLVPQIFNVQSGSLKENAIKMSQAYGWNSNDLDWRLSGDYYISSGWPLVTRKGDIQAALNALVDNYPIQPQLLKSTQHVFFVKEGLK